ncbi:hypothetical protein EHS25_000891 [Saitozyma podzolica]|uniref:Uncharacterized protein n=1 Tax=Saitozyma podzolica TaxID=1890683 RepID=A0A427YXJ4_9TREE|nr:hypothetical protein EHS25_000891 [Saitozyma podzolica]
MTQGPPTPCLNLISHEIALKREHGQTAIAALIYLGIPLAALPQFLKADQIQSTHRHLRESVKNSR